MPSKSKDASEPSGWVQRLTLPGHLVALTTLAVAQPVFDLITRTPQFLVARGLSSSQIMVLAILVWLAPPMIVAVSAEMVGWLTGSRGRRFVYLGGLALSSVIFTLLILRRIPVDRAVLAGPIAAACAAGFLWAYGRFQTFRALLGILAFLALVPPLAFLFASPATDLLLARPTSPEVPQGLRVDETPVVFIVLDELPASSLVDENGEVDEMLFPSLARLERVSTRYPDMAASAITTLDALPAMLTGRSPRDGLLATAQHHPDSLFSALASSHRIMAFEPRSDLCPESICSKGAGTGTHHLGADLAIVYLHLVLPADLAGRLPDVTTSWDQFTALSDKPSDVRRFLDSLELSTDERPPFVFAHLELPHHPWVYLPDGRSYYPGPEAFIDGLERGTAVLPSRWMPDGWTVLQGLQRHLLQLAFTDGLMGELFARLDEADLFDPSLIVVTADHGISFRPGGRARSLEPGNMQDIAGVPLWIKRPDQRRPAVDTRSASGVDLAPTVLSTLGAEWPWALDGRDLLDPADATERSRSVFTRPENVLLPLDQLPPPESHQITQMRWRAFPDPGGVDAFFRLVPGASPELLGLLGRAAAPLISPDSSVLQAQLSDMERIQQLDPESPAVPSRILGRLSAPEGRRARPLLALAVDGIVQAFTLPGAGSGEFSFMVAPAAWRQAVGRPAQFGLFEVTAVGGEIQLHTIQLPPAISFQVVERDGKAIALRDAAGHEYPMTDEVAGSIQGLVFEKRPFRVVFTASWSLPAGRQPAAVVAFAANDFLLLGNSAPTDRSGESFFLDAPKQQIEGQPMQFFLLDRAGAVYRLDYEQRLRVERSPLF